ncbi:MAG: nucleotidyltransferase substrate binding protein [Balneolales bacterium]
MFSDNNIYLRLRVRVKLLDRATLLLESGLGIKSPSSTERAGIIKFYEIAFQLSWRCIKDYLEIKGLNPKLPTEIIRLAVKHEVIDQADILNSALNDRYLLEHIYDEDSARSLEESIRNEYYPLLKDVCSFMCKVDFG